MQWKDVLRLVIMKAFYLSPNNETNVNLFISKSIWLITLDFSN